MLKVCQKYVENIARETFQENELCQDMLKMFQRCVEICWKHAEEKRYAECGLALLLYLGRDKSELCHRQCHRLTVILGFPILQWDGETVYFARISWKYVKNILKLVENVLRLCWSEKISYSGSRWIWALPEYVKNMLKIFQKFVENMLKICWNYAEKSMD